MSDLEVAGLVLCVVLFVYGLVMANRIGWLSGDLEVANGKIKLLQEALDHQRKFNRCIETDLTRVEDRIVELIGAKAGAK
jgi:hypothetical protein